MNLPPHHVRRSEIEDFETYTDQRDHERQTAMAIKAPRRVHLGDYLTFLFENHATIRYQVQEMMRAEKIVRESAIEEELTTYNELLGGVGQLGCALLIEIAAEADRKPLLIKWLGLQAHLYLVLSDGSRVYAEFDPAQVGDDRLSAVQYLTFSLDQVEPGGGPVAVGCDFSDLTDEIALTAEQQTALAADLAASRV
ncbi:MAG: DUF3501 family protein [Acidimicrobiales bacterium]|jgi:hypothetical protein|nr:DUF3501 family protein [Acidimicrobiales bacterium]